MKMQRQSILLLIAVVLPVWFILLNTAPAQQGNPDKTERKGLILFDFPGTLEARVEVNLTAKLISLVAKSVSNQPEVAELIQMLDGIYVRTYDRATIDEKELVNYFKDRLKNDQWEVLVKSKSDDETVEINLLFDQEKVYGIFAIIIEKTGEATFVNIFGEIAPERIEELLGNLSNFGAVDIDISSKLKTKAEPDAQQILQAAVVAHGGLEKLAAVQNIVLEGRGVLPSQGPGEVGLKVTYKHPDKYRVDADIPYWGQVSEIFDGQSAFTVNPTGEVEQASDEKVSDYKDGISQVTIWLLTHLSKNDVPIRYDRTEEVMGTPTSVILATQPSGTVLEIFINQETHHIVKYAYDVSTADATESREILFDDYRTVEGIQIAHHSVRKRDGELFTESWWSRVTLNEKLDKSLFQAKK